MSQCVIVPKKRRKIPTVSYGNPIIRIKPEAYNAIIDIADRTGWSITYIASQLLNSALEDVVIQQPEEKDGVEDGR